MKKPALFTTIALALCLPAARAQSDAGQLEEVMSTSSLVRRIMDIKRLPGHELEGHGQWMSPSVLRQGRIDAVIDGAEGAPALRLDALTTEYLPGVGMSGRFVYGGLYGTLYALDGTEAAPILVQGEWARHGQGSPNGSLVALVYRPAPFPQDMEVLGTLSGQIQFFDDGGAGNDGGPSFTISGVQTLGGANDAQGARAGRDVWMSGGARDGAAHQVAVIERFTGPDAGASVMQVRDDSGLQHSMLPPAAGGSSIGNTRLGRHLAVTGPEERSFDAGLARRIDRVGTCGTKDAEQGPAIAGHRLPSHQGIEATGATTMQIDGLVRVIYRVLD